MVQVPPLAPSPPPQWCLEEHQETLLGMDGGAGFQEGMGTGEEAHSSAARTRSGSRGRGPRHPLPHFSTAGSLQFAASLPAGKVDSYTSESFLSKSAQGTLGVLMELGAGLEEGLPVVPPRDLSDGQR